MATDANKLTLAYQIKQAYYTMLSAQRNIAVYAQNFQFQQSALAQEQALYDLKQAVDVDLQTAQINLKSAEVDLKIRPDRLGLGAEGPGQPRGIDRERRLRRGRDRRSPGLDPEPR